MAAVKDPNAAAAAVGVAVACGHVCDAHRLGAQPATTAADLRALMADVARFAQVFNIDLARAAHMQAAERALAAPPPRLPEEPKPCMLPQTLPEPEVGYFGRGAGFGRGAQLKPRSPSTVRARTPTSEGPSPVFSPNTAGPDSNVFEPPVIPAVPVHRPFIGLQLLRQARDASASPLRSSP